MLTVTIRGEERFDSSTNEFLPGEVIAEFDLEHSLVSVSKWESIFEKPFLDPSDKTSEEILAYIECMVLTPDFSPEVFSQFTKENLDEIQTYIESKQSATWFGNTPLKPGVPETITSELVYYWMVALEIPWEAQYWHLNRLLTLIRVINIKNSPPEELSPSEIAARNRALNEQRRRELGTSG